MGCIDGEVWDGWRAHCSRKWLLLPQQVIVDGAQLRGHRRQMGKLMLVMWWEGGWQGRW